MKMTRRCKLFELHIMHSPTDKRVHYQKKCRAFNISIKEMNPVALSSGPDCTELDKDLDTKMSKTFGVIVVIDWHL